MVRALTSHQCGLSLIPGHAIIIMWVEFVVGVPAPRGFSPGTLVFPSS